ncbi:MAG: hypothetical protein ACOC41_07230 [Chitinivibrionales bacterium]
MADLILSGSASDGFVEKYYEFDSENKAVIKNLKILLSLRKHGDKEEIERQIARLCAESMKQKRVADKGRKNLCRLLWRLVARKRTELHRHCLATQ